MPELDSSQTTPSPDANPEEESSARGPLAWLLWVPIAFLIYFLSVGPAIWVHRHTQNTGVRKFIETVYAPLEWAARKPVVGKVIAIYADWWQKISTK